MLDGEAGESQNQRAQSKEANKFVREQEKIKIKTTTKKNRLGAGKKGCRFKNTLIKSQEKAGKHKYKEELANNTDLNTLEREGQ